MKSYIINLDSATDRMEHMKTQFDRRGLDFIRVAATDARTMAKTELDLFRQSVAGGYRKHSWSVSQIGNFLSHMNVWRRIADSRDSYAAVFEDDVHFSGGIVPLLQNENWIKPWMGIVRLETTLQSMRLDTRPAGQIGRMKVVKLRSEAWGTAGYIIQREVAEQLTSSHPNLYEPTDWFLFHPRSAAVKMVKIFQVEPSPCVQDQYHPDLGHRRNFDKNTLDRQGWASELLKNSKRFVSPLVRKILGRRAVPFC